MKKNTQKKPEHVKATELGNVKIKHLKRCICGTPKSAKAIVCEKRGEDWLYIFERQKKTAEEFIVFTKQQGISPIGICSICGRYYIGGGHYAWSVVEPSEDTSAICCFRCNNNAFMPARKEAVFRSIKINKKGGK